MDCSSPLYLRIKQALQWLKQNKQILQRDVAAKMGITEVAFSYGMKRVKDKSDENFVISFHQATKQIFSLDWLLYGEGNMLDDKAKSSDGLSSGIPSWADSLIELVSSNTKSIEFLKKENESLRQEIRGLRNVLKSIGSDIRKAHRTATYDGKTIKLPIAAENINNQK